MAGIVASFGISVFSLLISIADVVMMPINFLVYKKPWRLRRRRSRWHRPHEFIYSGDTSEVVLKPAIPTPTCHNREAILAQTEPDRIDTLEKVFDYAVAKFADKPCVGTRKILGTRKHLNEDGKLLNKLLMEDR